MKPAGLRAAFDWNRREPGSVTLSPRAMDASIGRSHRGTTDKSRIESRGGRRPRGGCPVDGQKVAKRAKEDGNEDIVGTLELMRARRPRPRSVARRSQTRSRARRPRSSRRRATSRANEPQYEEWHEEELMKASGRLMLFRPRSSWRSSHTRSLYPVPQTKWDNCAHLMRELRRRLQPTTSSRCGD